MHHGYRYVLVDVTSIHKAEMNKVNHSDWFGYVTDLLHRKLLKDNGYGDRLEQALDERATYSFTTE